MAITGTGLFIGVLNMYWTKTAAVLHPVTLTDKIGIGTTTAPHGAIGAAKVAVDGADGHVDGPHLQFTTAADNYPLAQLLNWTHDAVYLSFDCSTVDGAAWLSSDAGSNFAIAKAADKLEFWYDSGIAQGGAITCNVGLSLGITGLVTSVQPLAINTAAGSVSTVGDLRGPDTFTITGWKTGDINVSLLSKTATDDLYVGGGFPNRPANIILDPATGVSIYANNSASQVARMYSGGCIWYQPLHYWTSTVVAPQIYQETDATAGVTGDDTTMTAQGVSDAAGNALAGDLGLSGGKGTVHAGNKDGNVWLHTAPAAWNAMEMGIFVGDCVTAPTGNPAAGGYMYSVAGAGTWRGSGGTITAFGPAGPRCGKCGHDHWKHASVNPRFGSYVLECGMCGKAYKGGPADVLGDLEAHELDELVFEPGDPKDTRPPHKKRNIIDAVVGPRLRRKDSAPTMQEYRAQWTAAIADAAVVDEEEVEFDTGRVDDLCDPVFEMQTIRTVDKAASRDNASARLVGLRAAWADAWQSWRDHYAGHDDEAQAIAVLEADIAASDDEADAMLASYEWTP